ncbi:YbaB/EbfC family nucleoid-associated protein [Paractinoplanes atraurantiacus]|uniref:YbaB/EbfC family nucleoid-associated protein n=1 Tax=Paractinoplanes atraurantiacus TaxID=1036182 RepID=UPI0015CF5A0C|nr:YbaB/EbfC family nucleoid-associated protein [Actinoplanes atraurantiacus]
MDGLAVERIEERQRGFEERAAQARALTERVAGLSATAREGDGIVEVTLGSNGQIVDLRLDEEIRRQPAAATARQILAAVKAADQELARQFAQATDETMGLDSATGQALMKGFRPQESG